MDIEAWLRGLGLERYADAFRANEVDHQILPTLTAEDLSDIGVKIIGHRRKILNAAALLEHDPVAVPSDVSAEEQNARTMPSSTASEAERRHLTLMFVDLVGSTALSSQLDPEEMRQLMRGYQNAVAGEVTHFRGHVAKFLGDGVLAYFGFPQAHEDDAERSVRAALSIMNVLTAVDTRLPSSGAVIEEDRDEGGEGRGCRRQRLGKIVEEVSCRVPRFRQAHRIEIAERALDGASIQPALHDPARLPTSTTAKAEAGDALVPDHPLDAFGQQHIDGKITARQLLQINIRLSHERSFPASRQDKIRAHPGKQGKLARWRGKPGRETTLLEAATRPGGDQITPTKSPRQAVKRRHPKA